MTVTALATEFVRNWHQIGQLEFQVVLNGDKRIRDEVTAVTRLLKRAIDEARADDGRASGGDQIGIGAAVEVQPGEAKPDP